jgi:hypothetical protein
MPLLWNIGLFLLEVWGKGGGNYTNFSILCAKVLPGWLLEGRDRGLRGLKALNLFGIYWSHATPHHTTLERSFDQPALLHRLILIARVQPLKISKEMFLCDFHTVKFFIKGFPPVPCFIPYSHFESPKLCKAYKFKEDPVVWSSEGNQIFSSSCNRYKHVWLSHEIVHLCQKQFLH